jgi:Domain of unknown function (DUF222)
LSGLGTRVRSAVFPGEKSFTCFLGAFVCVEGGVMSVQIGELMSTFGSVVAGGVTVEVAERPRLEEILRDCARVTSFVESVRLRAITCLDALPASSPVENEDIVVQTSRSTRRQAQAAQKRASTVAHMPALANALENGQVGSAHVDTVAQTLARMEPSDRSKLSAESDWVAEMATRLTPEQLSKRLQQRVRELSADDGIATLERQRRAAFLRHWTDKDTGMVCLYGQFDPESGAKLVGRVRNAVEALFHDRVPDTCPVDERKQDHLRALALVKLAEGEAVGSGRPELTVVIDLQTLLDGAHAKSRIDISSGVTLPVETIRRMACYADIIPAVLGADGVLLDLGRSTRLASAHQRRALRVMYSTCAVGNCDVSFDNCTMHHVSCWRRGGKTDIGNMLPLCSKHHHLAHEGGWKFHLDVERTLTITKPDGSRQTHPPPLAGAG